MLLFVAAAAAAHNNYIYSLSLCLSEINNLKDSTPYVYQYFTKGQHGVRKKAGSFKSVNSDMAHGQTYNIDLKESASGLT